jgi:hypothetical protein
MNVTSPDVPPRCGVVMPISAIDDCSDAHWADVRSIHFEAIKQAGFEPQLVSDADEIGLIHKRIIENLYDNPIVVCDVSGKNPNVMFELGIRLAFDKPTIIVKDNATAYSFDTSPIEHVGYRRDLRFADIVSFQSKLAEKVRATYDKSQQDKNYTTFLKHFGEFKVPKLEKKEVPSDEIILDELRGLRELLRRQGGTSVADRRYSVMPPNTLDICFRGDAEKISQALSIAGMMPEVLESKIHELRPGHEHLLVSLAPGADAREVERVLRPPRRPRLQKSE